MKRILGASITSIAILSQGLAFAGYSGYANWTGFYVGANGGAGFNKSAYSLEPTGCFLTGICGGGSNLNYLRSDTDNFNNTNFTGGVLIGYNRQFYNDEIIAGIEADFDYSGANQTINVNRALVLPLGGRFAHSVSQRFDWYGTVRLRLGGPIACRWLIYGTAGYAYGHVRSSTSSLFTLGGDGYNGSASSTLGGWAMGAGSEYAFADNWSARLEYLYIDLGSYSYQDNGNALAPVNGTYNTTISTRENLLRLSVNYKFSAF